MRRRRARRRNRDRREQGDWFHGRLHALAPVQPLVDVTALDALDIRVGAIVAIADVPRSRKLVKLTVDFGGFPRLISWLV